MIPKDCKRLAEVDFPIAEVSRHAAREKSIRHGHPKTLHLWWARRPLASSRAVLLALLWPDPCDPLCPSGVQGRGAEALAAVVGGCDPGTTDEDLRKALLKFIADFANWDNAAQRTYLEVSRALVKAAHGEEPPLVVDPFAGGGSIPLEALRLGCEAFASDLNPVACLILKVMLEDIPRHGPKLAEELRRARGRRSRRRRRRSWPTSTRRIRTARRPSPTSGRGRCAASRRTAARRSRSCARSGCARRRTQAGAPAPGRAAAGEPPRVEFEIFEPKGEKDVPGGTVTRAKATCVCCGAVLPPERVRAQLAAQRGGADVVFDAKGRRTGGARMLAVVTLKPARRGGATGCRQKATTRRVARRSSESQTMRSRVECGETARSLPGADDPRQNELRRTSASRSTACSSGATCSRRGKRCARDSGAIASCDCGASSDTVLASDCLALASARQLDMNNASGARGSRMGDTRRTSFTRHAYR